MTQTEASVQTNARVIASRNNSILWRNNNGAFNDGNRWVRYGLGNDSKGINEKMKSSDLIGIRSFVVQPHHVGMTIGQFVAVECKPTGWHLTPGDKRGHAQQEFLDVVRRYGGQAGFATSDMETMELIQCLQG